MSDTPRTDAVFAAASSLQGSMAVVPEGYPPCDPWKLARELERELATAREFGAKVVETHKVLMAEADRRYDELLKDSTRSAIQTRACTCHPDDNPPKPCPQKYALTECREAPAPHVEDDGYGNRWQCMKGKPTGECEMQIVRPGKVQCECRVTTQHGNGNEK